MDPLSDPSHSTFLGWKCPVDRQGSHSPALPEHFEGLFSDRRTVQKSSLDKIPQVEVKLELDDPSTHEEIKKATMQLKVG